jgi:hypothetical protein
MEVKMSLTKEDLVFDLYYASSTDEEGNKLAQLTVQFRDASAVPHVTTQLARTTLKRSLEGLCRRRAISEKWFGHSAGRH